MLLIVNQTMMSKADNFVFRGLYVVTWLIFVSLCIETGSLIVNFVLSIYSPDLVKNLYQKLDLTEIYYASKLAFFSIYTLIISISFLKAFLFYMVIKLMRKMDLLKPFNNFVSGQILQIGYCTLSIGLLSYITKELTKNLVHYDFVTENLNQFWAESQAFILMGAVIYIIAIILKRWVAIQDENSLTI